MVKLICQTTKYDVIDHLPSRAIEEGGNSPDHRQEVIVIDEGLTESFIESCDDLGD